ncbi:MAG: FUSC family protein [Bryobacteraceae bacterium]
MTFWQSVFRFQSEKIVPWLALRNTIGIALPLAAGVAAGHVTAGLAVSSGALNVSFSDSHDPYIQRARRMAAASAAVGLAVYAGALCGGNHALTVAVAGAWAFAAGLLVALSTAAGDLGVISLVTLVVFAARPLPVHDAAAAGLLAFGGGLLQTALSLAFWPVRRHVPERRAIGEVYLELARLAASPPQVLEAPAASTQATEAQTALSALGADHSIEGERLRVLLSEAERARLGLFALARLRVRIGRDPEGAAQSRTVEDYLQKAQPVLHAVGAALTTGGPVPEAAGDIAHLQLVTEELRDQTTRQPQPLASMLGDARLQMDALTGQLRAAAELAAGSSPEALAAFARKQVQTPWRLRFGGTLATLRANLNLESAAFRHAVRLSICVALSEAIGRGLELRRSYWMPMTIAIVLKPDFGSTFTRGVLRLAGTAIGLVLSTAIVHFLPARGFVQVAGIGALAYILRCWGPANYGLFATAVTGLVVLLVAMTGVSPKEVIAARGLNTALGGIISFLAYWIWPTWERARIPEDLARMLDAYRGYFRVIRQSYTHPHESFAHDLDRVRLAARLARSNLETAIDRWRLEPRNSSESIRRLSGAMAASHRLVHAIMALEAGLSSSRPVPARQPFARFANDVELTLYYLAAALRGSPVDRASLPDLREDHHELVHSPEALTERYALVNIETDRITNSLNTLSEELLRWLEQKP